MQNFEELSNYHKKALIVNNEPYGHCFIEKFFPDDTAKKLSTSFKFPDEDLKSKDVLFQKTKRILGEYHKFPKVIKNVIDYLNSPYFIKVLEEKFNLRNLLPDPTLFGGGMHESRNGGYLKIHSDFVYIRRKKLKRRLNVLIYLNENWDEKWNGALELWNQDMSRNFLKVFPHLNHCVIFRTDTESNHGFPDPISCPNNVGRKSLAVYYYTEDNSFFKRTKLFYARWKKRPGVKEPKFGDNRNLFERIKNAYFYRFK